MTHRNGRMAAVVAGAISAVLWSGPTGLAQEAAPGAAEDTARAEAIRQTLAGIESQLQEHGGTWAKWLDNLQTYREDRNGSSRLKWPWPAEKGYVFQGAALDILRRESFDNLPDGERPLEALVHFSRQLKPLGVDLVVAV